MKKILLLRLILCFLAITTVNSSYGILPGNPSTTIRKNEVLNYLKGSEFVKLSAKQIMEITGKKMNLWQRVSFGIIRIKIKHDLKKYRDLTLSSYSSNSFKSRIGTIWWILIGIAAILLIAVVAFIIAYSGGGD